ncbi:Hypothetical predicted protein, partial [Paramuricea clavata]
MPAGIPSGPVAFDVSKLDKQAHTFSTVSSIPEISISDLLGEEDKLGTRLVKKNRAKVRGNQVLRPSNLISSHNIHRLGECFILCIEQDNCFGYNFRVRPSTIYTVNCQLSNSSVKINITTMKNGPWVYYEDIL